MILKIRLQLFAIFSMSFSYTSGTAISNIHLINLRYYEVQVIREMRKGCNCSHKKVLWKNQKKITRRASKTHLKKQIWANKANLAIALPPPIVIKLAECAKRAGASCRSGGMKL